MPRKTSLHDAHRRAGARMVDFGGWEMPLNYGSQIEEHHRVRRDAGMFDVSHMTVVDLTGTGAWDFLRKLVANSVDKLKAPGKALYTCMLNEQGGVVDDLIVYRMAGDEGAGDWFRIVVNAATRDKDMAWIGARAEAFEVEVGERPELAMIAVQGPNARAKSLEVIAEGDRARIGKLVKFAAAGASMADGTPLFVARTGYTGEDGFEIMVAEGRAEALWDALLAVGVEPAGLGARDTLRLEAGMALYGQDMDDTVSPYEASLGWTVALDEGRDFIGRAALEAQLAAGVPRQMVGLVMDDKGVLRHGQAVLAGKERGEILSGTFSPTLGQSIAFARIPAGEPGDIRVDIRGREVPVRVVDIPFVRNGASLVPAR